MPLGPKLASIEENHLKVKIHIIDESNVPQINYAIRCTS